MNFPMTRYAQCHAIPNIESVFGEVGECEDVVCMEFYVFPIFLASPAVKFKPADLAMLYHETSRIAFSLRVRIL